MPFPASSTRAVFVPAGVEKVVLDKRQRERLLVQYGGTPNRRRPGRVIAASINWEIFLGFLVLLGFFSFLLWQGQQNLVVPGTVGLVAIGWVFSLCLHEFSHAAVAVLGGDDSETTQHFLSFNPLHYVNTFTSIVLPLLFLFLGGIGLPGGAVYIRRDRLRSRGWQSAVSLAGPCANLVILLIVAALFHTSLFDAHAHPDLANALAFLALIEASAVLLNLLPIPPLDGFGVIAPYLPRDLQALAYTFSSYGMLVVFLLLWFVPPVNVEFWKVLGNALLTLGIDPELALTGLSTFTFWQKP